MLKIDIISGFLGAGKTTFIERLLKTEIKNEKVVLVENEYGEVSVDTDILKDTKIEMKELSQGCICCSLVGDFTKALGELVKQENPDRILIEPSGVGKLSDIVAAVTKAGLGKNINSLVCLVDAKKAKMYAKNFGEFFNDQISNAYTVILSRTDIANEDKVKEALEVIREINSKAVVVTTPISKLSDDELVKAYEGFDTAEAGEEVRICARCGETETLTLDALGHQPGEPVIENYVEPTGSAEGGYDTVVYCQRCSKELSREHTTLSSVDGPNADGHFYLGGEIVPCYQFVEWEGDWYFINDDDYYARDIHLDFKPVYVEGTPFEPGCYYFDAMGRLVIQNGPQANGYFYLNGIRQKAYQVLEYEGSWYFITDGNRMAFDNPWGIWNSPPNG